MRIDDLTTLLTVARTRNFSQAAKELKTSQGTVSNHISALEEQFETKLFERTANGVEVTETGLILIETAKQILQETQDAKIKINNIKNSPSGTIKIAASNIPGEHILPKIIDQFQKNHPNIKLKIESQDSLTSLNSLLKKVVDFAAVGTTQGFEEEIEFTQIGEDQLVLITPKNHKLGNRKAVNLKEIAQYTLIYRQETSGTRREIEKLFEINKIQLDKREIAFELGSTEAVITAVSEDRGLSVISSVAAAKAEAADLVKCVNIIEAKNKRKIYLARPKRMLPKVQEKFWEFCRNQKF